MHYHTSICVKKTDNLFAVKPWEKNDSSQLAQPTPSVHIHDDEFLKMLIMLNKRPPQMPLFGAFCHFRQL